MHGGDPGDRRVAGENTRLLNATRVFRTLSPISAILQFPGSGLNFALQRSHREPRAGVLPSVPIQKFGSEFPGHYYPLSLKRESQPLA